MQQQMYDTLRQIHQPHQQVGNVSHQIDNTYTRKEKKECVPTESAIGGMNPGQETSILEWMQQADAIDELASESSDSTPYTEISSVFSAGRHDEQRITDASRCSVSASRSPDIPAHQPDVGETEEDSCSEDGFFLDAAIFAIKTGKDAFEQQDYAEASSTLEEALRLVDGLPTNKQTICDLCDLRFMLGVCAFHLQEPAEAEPALLHILESAAKAKGQANAQRLKVCDASHFLSQTYVKLGKIDQARQHCTNALQGRRRLLGKSHDTYFESLALLIRIEDLDGKGQRSKIYSNLIPNELRVDLLKRFSELDILPSTKRRTQTEAVDSPDAPEPSVSSDILSRVASKPESELPKRPTISASPQPTPTVERQPSKISELPTSSTPTSAVQSSPTAKPSTPKISDRRKQPTPTLPAQASHTAELEASSVSGLAAREVVSPPAQPGHTAESKEIIYSRLPARPTSSTPSEQAESKPIAQPGKPESSRFALSAARYGNEALRKLVHSRGYTPPGPADASMRRMWASWFGIKGDTALRAALLAGNRSVAIKLAKEHGKMANWEIARNSSIWPDPTPKIQDSSIPELHCAALFGELKVVQTLLTRHVKASCKSDNGRLAIEFASMGGYKEIVEVLRAAGSALGSALAYATLLERLDVVDTILGLETRPNDDWATHAACIADNPLMLEAVWADGGSRGQYARLRADELLGMRKAVTLKAAVGSNTRHFPPPRMKDRDDEIVKSINAQPFGVAAYCGSVASLQHLINKGVAPSTLYEATGSRGTRIYYTALDFASMKGYVDAVRCLLDRGAAHTSTSRGIYSDCLYVAVVNGQRSCEDLLLENGALVNERTWLIAARAEDSDDTRMGKLNSSTFSRHARVEALRCLIGAHQLCDTHNSTVAKYARQIFNTSSPPGPTQLTYKLAGSSTEGSLLHIAVIEKDLCAVGWLLELGMAVDVQDREGRTPLLLATELWEFEIAELLIGYNASKTKQSKEGCTPSQRIRESTSLRWRILFDDDRFELSKPPRANHACAKRQSLAENRTTKRQVIAELQDQGMAELQGCDAALEVASDSLLTDSTTSRKGA